MRPAVKRAIIGVIVIALIVIAVMRLTEEKPVAVVVKAVDTGRVESTVANTRAGTVKACRRARLSPETGGQIAKLWVREGERVEAGKVLLELWNADRRASLDLAESEARASASQAVEACLVADEAQREANRLLKLQQRQLASEKDIDQATTGAKAQQARCEAARATASVSKARIAVARAALDQTLLVAPFTGTVAKINGELAEFVTPSPIGVATPPAVDLIDISCVYISAPIDEVDAPAITAGMDASIVVDAFPGRHFPGIVQRVAPYVLEVEKQARTVDVETVFLNPEDFSRMLPGFSADVEIILDKHDDVVRVPTEAVLEGGRVLVFDPSEGRLVERKITTGLTNWKLTEAVSGIRSGELVVTSVDRKGAVAGAKAVRDDTP
ncbi:MAG: HlyD family secretion protein [Gammaproteobacteria bacterium]|nr:MAG: HlyD family secretion protein [Gammaproteobacteria bacterium]TND06796.1 MAG: HlyD family secretion protein [Gammaproteobacteria bacterium]